MKLQVVAQVGMAALAFVMAVPGLVRADGCSGAVTWGPGTTSTIDCLNPCASFCQSQVITIQGVGQGAVCICKDVGWTGCCTVALVPPNGSGAGIPTGFCGQNGCPWSGTCGAHQAIIQGGPNWIFYATPYCTGGG